MQRVREKRRSRNFIVVLVCVAGFLWFLTACGEKTKALKEHKSQAAPAPKKEKAVTPAVKKEKAPDEEVVAYHYDPMGKKDPFQPLIRVETRIADKIMVEGPLTPLQKYSLAELKLVAIVVGLGDPRAMVEDAKGDGYIIAKGTLIGDKYGEVTEITKDEVVVTEKEIDPSSGEIVYKKESLILHKPEEEEL